MEVAAVSPGSEYDLTGQGEAIRIRRQRHFSELHNLLIRSFIFTLLGFARWRSPPSAPAPNTTLPGRVKPSAFVGSATSANFITYSFDHLYLRYLALLVHFRYPGQAAIIEIDAQFCTTLHNNP